MSKSLVHTLRLLSVTTACFIFGTRALTAAGLLMDDSTPLRMPQVGDHQLRLLSPTLLEVTLITTKAADPATVTQWNFVDTNGNLTLPSTSDFAVTINGQAVTVQSVGFRRRILYAPLKVYDLRIGNYLYLQLSAPVANGSVIQVQNPATDLWNANTLFTLTVDPLRYSPAIHVNQVGYIPALSKTAMIGLYLGSLGELPLSTAAYPSFQLVNAQSGVVAYTGNFVPRPDIGWLYTPTPYQQILEADFSAFQTPGEYKLVVPGLGASWPFLIDNGVAGTFARTYELGIYHQRCGTSNSLPYTRFDHDLCHAAPATVPLSGAPLTFVNNVLAQASITATNDPLETAPRMTNIWASLYPYVNTNAVDTRGGHHDAGDYSKYTTSVANFIHNLIFTVDNFPGVSKLDNLGIPESGDGISDILQEAKWEADYIAKLQDADGGFYFIVYPATRTYESNVTPDHGDPQIVLPKNTACTAAAVGALADMASSPAFKAAYPTVASNYLAKALMGWTFLTNAITKYGRNGAYQTITFSGDTFMHNDELAWAAAALYTATGDPQFDNDLRTNTPNPNDPSLRRWGWWGMYACYGNAFRDYAFAARSGRLQTNKLNATYLAQCESEVRNQGTNEVQWAQQMAYGSSFANDNKGSRTAGWYFSGEQTFDLAVAYLIDPQPTYLSTILENFNYEMGCNPLNVSFLTGTGWKRQREIVDQYAQNSFHVLPPTGIPLGNIQQGFYWTTTYASELSELSYANDNSYTAPYPMYDRWADAYNVTTEFVVSQETTRSLPAAALLMSMSGLATQTWNSATAQIAGLPATSAPGQPVTATLSVPVGLDLTSARIVWEAQDQEPYLGTNFIFTPKYPGNQWVEVEAQLRDGRRVFARTNFTAALLVTNTIAQYQTTPLANNTNVMAWYNFNGTYADKEGREPALVPAGNAAIDQSSFVWTNETGGGALAVHDLGDQVTVTMPDASIVQAGTTGISIEAMFFINSFMGYGVANANIFALVKSWNTGLSLQQNTWQPTPAVIGGTNTIMSDTTAFAIPTSGPWRLFAPDGTAIVADYATLPNNLALGQWQHLKIMLNTNAYTVFIDGTLVAQANSADLQMWPGNGTLSLTAGNFNGWIDDIVIKSGGMQISNIVTVTPPVLQSLTLQVATSLAVGGATPATLSANYPSVTNNVTADPATTYQSGNANVFTVSSTGLVTPIGAGSATLTASYGGLQASQTLLVTAYPVAGLAFTTQPGLAFAGATFGQQPVLRTVDQFGHPTTLGLPATLIVNVALTNGSGALLGTTNYNIGTSGSNGVVTLANLAVNTPGTGDQLIASTASVPSNPVSGAVLWLDAADLSTLTTNSTKVQAWKNKGAAGAGTTGTNLWFTQNTASLQPTIKYGANGLNGNSVLTFSDNGSGNSAGGDFLGNIGGKSYTNSGSQMTYFVVASQTANTSNWRGPVSFSASGQIDGKGAAGVVVLADGSQTSPYPLGIQRNLPNAPMQADIPVPSAAGTPFVLTYVDNAGAASLYYTDQNGNFQTNGANIVNGMSPYNYAITDVTVGGRLEPDPGTVDNCWPGNIAEVLVYNTALSVANRTAVESYLKSKWLVAAASGPAYSVVSAPFNVAPPGSFQSVTLQLANQIPVGQAAQATALANFTTQTNNVTAAGATFQSANPGVASVNAAGLVIAQAQGSARIIASYGGLSATNTVTVIAGTPQSLTLEVAASLATGAITPATLSANYQYATNIVTADPAATYQSANASVVSVNGTGVVTAMAAGSATLTASYGGLQASQAIVVTTYPVAGLAFSTQPGSVLVSAPLEPLPVLRTVDEFGDPSTLGLPATLIVNVALANGSGTLLGTTSYNIGTSGGNGVVTLANLAINAPGSDDELIASATTAPSNPIPGAVLWLDAADLNTLTTNPTNSSKVQAWKNKGTAGAGSTGTNLWFTQYTPGLQPSIKSGANGLNGNSVLTFNDNGSGDGVGGDFLGNIGGKSYTNNGSQMTYFIVADQTANNAIWRGPVSFSGSNQIDGKGTAGVVILADGSQTSPYPLGIQRNLPAAPMQANVPVPFVAGTAFMMTFVDNAGAASLYYTDQNGNFQTNGANIVNGISPYTYAITDVTVGGRLEPDPGTVDNCWPGDIAEVLVYNTALSVANRTAVENYLKNKWLVAGGNGVSYSAVSAPFAVQTGTPPRPGITGVTVNVAGSAALTYATTPGFNYRVLVATNLSSPVTWTFVPGSATNAPGTAVTFTDIVPAGSHQRFYRIVSP